MKKNIAFSFTLLIVFAFNWQPIPYKLFDSKGKEQKFDQLLSAAQEADIILFGELHNDPIMHWLQLQLTKELYKEKKDQLVLGAEMFESDNQLIMNEYLAGDIKEDHFKTEAKMWPNYATDYRPLVEFAKAKKLNFIATNIPRRYASIVARKGKDYLNKLDKGAHQYMMPLPLEVDLELPQYKMLLKQMGQHGGASFVHAQASKDATMAHFILKNWKKGQTFLHFNGTFHSDKHEGIAYYLKKANPELKILCISACSQEKLKKLDKEYHKNGDFIICTAEDMTKTY